MAEAAGSAVSCRTGGLALIDGGAPTSARPPRTKQLAVAAASPTGTAAASGSRCRLLAPSYLGFISILRPTKAPLLQFSANALARIVLSWPQLGHICPAVSRAQRGWRQAVREFLPLQGSRWSLLSSLSNPGPAGTRWWTRSAPPPWSSAVPYAAKQCAWPKFSGLNLALGRLSPPVGAAGPVQHSG